MKRYKLLKDLPNAKTGGIFQRKTDDVTLVDIIYKIDSEETALAPTYHIEDITNFDEWFEEIKETNWKPEKYQQYWYITGYGVIDSVAWDDDGADNIRYSLGNCYCTKAEAEYSKKVQIARTKIRRSSNFVPDWNNMDQIKYYVIYDHATDCLRVYSFFCSISNGVIVYYETREDAKQAIKDLKSEYLLHFGIKQ